MLHAGLPVSSSQVDTQATNFGGQQENKHILICVEVIHQAGSEADRRGAIHAVVAVARPLHTPLQDVQHLLRLCEQQRPVALLLPVIQHLQKLSAQSHHVGVGVFLGRCGSIVMGRHGE